jgi:hypothetical protein
MRKLNLYIFVACVTFIVGVIANKARFFILRENLSAISGSGKVHSLEVPKVQRHKAYDPCAEPLEVARTGMVIRATPFSVIQACVKADQAQACPLIDAKRAKSILGPKFR